MCIKTFIDYIFHKDELSRKQREIDRRLETLKHREELLERQMEVYEKGEKRLFSIIKLQGEKAEKVLRRNVTIIENGDMIQNN